MKKSMSAYIREFIAERRRFGYAASREAEILPGFGKYMDETWPNRPLGDDVLLVWANQKSEVNPSRILAAFLNFAPWLALRESDVAVSDEYLHERAHPRKQPYIYEPREISALLRECKIKKSMDLSAGWEIRSASHHALLGLLSSTGIRVGEGISLKDSDVQLHKNEMFVRKSKNVPIRLVPLHPSTTRVLEKYLETRNRAFPVSRTDAFFISGTGSPILYRTLLAYFRRLCIRAGIPVRQHWRLPRIHDLRHTFACRHLVNYLNSGKNLHCAIADLSVYLGHKEIANTYWYLTGVPEMLDLVGQRFQKFIDLRRKRNT